MPWKPIDGERVFTFEYPFGGGGRAHSCAIRGRPGELIVLSPPCGLTDADFAEIEKQGRPVALVATNGYHHLGLPEWHRRYPEAKLYAPAKAAARIRKKHADLPAFQAMSTLSGVCPHDVVVYEPPGMRIPDVAARVATSKGWLWSFNDTVMNHPKLPPGLFGKVMKWTDSGPGFKVARFFTLIALNDKKAFKSWLLGELAKAPPALVVPSHGLPVLDADEAGHLPEMVERAI